MKSLCGEPVSMWLPEKYKKPNTSTYVQGVEVVAENASAVRLYESVGFQEYGRNPRGFRARSGWQTLVLMRLELDS